MKDVAVTEFRKHLRAFLTKVSGGQRLRVTAHGRVIAEVSPPSITSDAAAKARARLRNSVATFSKPLAPVIEPEEWDMNR
jgi:antitoxin (DNA-binding transcriptional repressor) of toxin-antitoxin stability system